MFCVCSNDYFRLLEPKWHRMCSLLLDFVSAIRYAFWYNNSLGALSAAVFFLFDGGVSKGILADYYVDARAHRLVSLEVQTYLVV